MYYHDYTIISKINFFDVIDKESTIKNAKKAFCDFKKKWLKNHKSGGITATTFDVFHALLSCVAPTLEDIKENQPGVLAEALEQGRLFAFTYWSTLATKINNLKDESYADLKLSKKTIYNQINRLIDCGIIIEKRNYKSRKEQIDNVNGKPVYRLLNPTPDDLHPKGHGKIQLFFNPEILKLKPNFAPLLLDYKKTLQQYNLTVLNKKNKEQITIIDNVNSVDNEEAFAYAHSNNNLRNKEQGRKLFKPTKFNDAKYKTKAEFFTQELFNFCRAEIYNGKEFSAAESQQTMAIIDSHLETIGTEIEHFKATKIKTFTTREKFQSMSEGKRSFALRKYSEKLPVTQDAALEILMWAIRKHATNSKKNGYIGTLGNPSDVLASENFYSYAIGFSLDDWRRINNKAYYKSIKMQRYCEFMQEIGKSYLKTLSTRYEFSISHAYAKSLEFFKNIRAKITRDEELSQGNKNSLLSMYKKRLKPLFTSLSEGDKERIIQATNV